MGVTHADSHEEGIESPHASGHDAPTSQMFLGAVSDRCANCGAPLASDQRYCVQCGERRGKGRFSVVSPAPPAVTTTTTQPSAALPPRRRGPSSATVVAGIATLVLAMGVGVEIGSLSKSSNSGSSGTAKPTVIQLNGNGASAAATTTGATSTPVASAKPHAPTKVKGSEAKKATQAASAPKPTKQAVQKASNAASSVLGAGTGQSNATVTTGQSCAAGSAGCTGGHFDGSFFGGS